MWIWSIISLIILIACVIFAYRMIVSSYEFLPSDKRYFLRFKKDSSSQSVFPEQPDVIKILRNKVQHVEDNSTFYNIQFSRFQDRLKVIEEKVAASSKTGMSSHQAVAFEEEEDWKELYYEENAKKEGLENDLDFARQALEEAEAKLNDLEQDSQNRAALQSDYESRLRQIQSLQENAIDLQKKLDASIGREKELEQLLLSEILVREKYALLQQQYGELLSESDDIRRRMNEMGKVGMQYQQSRKDRSQLESKLFSCQEENLKLKADHAKLLVQQNKFDSGQDNF